MRISKIMVALLVSVVAVTAMTGVAVADDATVVITANPIINPLDGTTVTTTTVTVSDIWWTLGDPQTRHISVKTSNANLFAKVTGNGVNTDWTTGAEAAGRVGDNWTANSSVALAYTFTLHVNGTQEGSVTVADNFGTVFNDTSAADSASCTRQVLVPEFVTIAIPAIAVLGLFLFFNKRKHKKD
jgi:hypothetical protein